VGGYALQNLDDETYGMVMLLAEFNLLVSIGSLLCSITLIVKNHKKSTLDVSETFSRFLEDKAIQ
jgi:hypothetical protein